MREKEILHRLERIEQLLINCQKANIEMPISELETCTLLGISKKTMQNYVSEGRMIGTFDVSITGQRLFYRSRLIRKI